MRDIKINTSTQDPIVRYFYLGIALILRNLWVWIKYQSFSLKRSGPRGRTILDSRFSFETFKSWISSAISDLYGFVEQISITLPLPPEVLRFR